MSTTPFDEKLSNTGFVSYRGFRVVRKRDFGRQGNHNDDGTPKGYVVTDGTCNVLPGATWSHTLRGATELVDAFIEAGAERDGILWNVDSDKFWEIVRQAKR